MNSNRDNWSGNVVKTNVPSKERSVQASPKNKFDYYKYYSDVTNVKTVNNLILVNKWNPIEENFVPNGLKSLYSNGKYLLPVFSAEISLNNITIADASKMFDDVKKENLDSIAVTSGYRSYQDQKILHNDEISKYQLSLGKKLATEKASEVVAAPGTSEHQTGLAIDICKRSDPTLTQKFIDTAEGKWLDKNCWKYGFVVRYKEDKKNKTCILYEPWHLRYVGIPHSEIIYSNNFCFEEYIEHLKKNSVIKFKSDHNSKSYTIIYLTHENNLNTTVDTNSKVLDITKFNDNSMIVTLEN